MAFVLKVIVGAEEGRSYAIEPGENMIGRSPTASIQIQDDSIAWEHGMLVESDGVLTLSNLSALGIRLRGRRVDEEVRVRAHDEILLSDRCRVVIEERVGAGDGPSSRLTNQLILAIGVLLLVAAGLFVVLTPDEPPANLTRPSHWREAYQRLSSRTDLWIRKGWFPAEGRKLLQDGWRLEHAGNHQLALQHWDSLRGLLLTVTLPSSAEGQTMSQSASATHRSLEIVMRKSVGSSAGSMNWNSDDVLSDALVWFARERAASCRRRVEAEENS